MRALEFSKEDQPLVKQFSLITAKPAMFVANVAEDGFENNPFLDRLREYADKQDAPVVAICAKIEAELSEMDDEDKKMFLAEIGQDGTRPGPPDPRRLQAAGPADLLHRRREGSACLDHPHRRYRPAGRWRDPR